MPTRLVAAMLVAVTAGPAWAGQDSLSATSSLSPDANAVKARAEQLARAGRLQEAEAVYRDWFARNPKSAAACEMLAGFLVQRVRTGTRAFDEATSTLETCVTLGHAGEADAHQTMAALYWDEAYRDATLTDGQKSAYADRGLRHVDQALELKPNLYDAMIYKGLLLRIKAFATTSAAKRAEYLRDATALQRQALDLKDSGNAEVSRVTLPVPPPRPPAPPRPPGQPPPPPPPPPRARTRGAPEEVEGGVPGGVAGGVPGGVVGGVPGGVVGGVVGGPPMAVRVGGEIKEPRKTKDVPPVYPAIAQQARVQGIVILECTIGPKGNVVDVKILRGVPLLDAAAVEAVKQWEYTPTLLNGVPVPVIMTVTVNFRLS